MAAAAAPFLTRLHPHNGPHLAAHIAEGSGRTSCIDLTSVGQCSARRRQSQGHSVNRRNSFCGTAVSPAPRSEAAGLFRLRKSRKIQAVQSDVLGPAIAAMETVFYPVGSQYIWNLALPALTVFAAFGAFQKESSGDNMAYGRFAKGSQKRQIPSQLGMLLLYSPPVLIALYYFLMLGDAENLGRAKLMASLLGVHFGKRVLEVLFLHKFSGSQDLSGACLISGVYSFNTFALLVVQTYVCTNSPPPALDLSYLGVAVFAVGILGNFYHHAILAGLRKDKNGGYQVPQGGLFGLVTCPHYLFEIVDFVGLALASQTFYGVAWAVYVAAYLSGRSVSTRNWYLKKVEGYPEERKNILPFLF